MTISSASWRELLMIPSIEFRTLAVAGRLAGLISYPNPALPLVSMLLWQLPLEQTVFNTKEGGFSSK